MATLLAINNTDAVHFWFFGDTEISKLAIIGGVFFAGWLIGFLMGKSDTKPKDKTEFEEYEQDDSVISQEDRDYIN